MPAAYKSKTVNDRIKYYITEQSLFQKITGALTKKKGILRILIWSLTLNNLSVLIKKSRYLQVLAN